MSDSCIRRTPVNSEEGSSCVDTTIKSLFTSLGIDANRSMEMESINLSYKYLTEKEVRVLGRGQSSQFTYDLLTTSYINITSFSLFFTIIS